MNQLARIMTIVVVFFLQPEISHGQMAKLPIDPDLKFGHTIGLNVHFNQGETQEHLQTLLDLKIDWVRDTELWRKIELKPGEYQLPDTLVERLAFYKQHDIGICFGLWYSNAVAYPDDPYSPEAYGRYAAFMAEALRDNGVRYILEIWNEPHNFVLGPKFGGNWHGAPPSPWVDQYLKLVHAAVKAVKEKVPEAKLLINEDVISSHYWFVEAGVPKDLNGVAIHPYSHKPTSGPETLVWVLSNRDR